MIYEYNGLIFEWNDEKAKKVYQDHKITMEEACTVFFDENEFTTIDSRFGYNEERYITIGMSNKIRLLVVAWTERNENIRLITAIKAENKYEQKYRKRF